MKYVLAAVILAVIAAAAVFLPVRPYLDFQLIYHANLGLLRGISLYDHAGQVSMIAELAQVPASQVYVLPFPYPPWYALGTLWLVLLPIDLAVRAWFAANLTMLMLALWLLTRGQPGVRRVLFFVAGLFWLPVLGGLFVGQYAFPVLLGAALMIDALRTERAILFALAAGLLTFKPHLGGPILILVAILLIQRRGASARRALLAMGAAAGLLFGVGFFASPGWPLAYYHSLTGFRDVSQCGQCVSLPMAAATAAGGAFEQAIWIALFAAAALGAWLAARWRQVSAAGSGFITLGILLTSLVSPYLQNYDYLLLLVPLIELGVGARRLVEWMALATAYVIPWISLALWGTGGNNSLIVSAVVLFALAATKLWASKHGGAPQAPA